MSPKSSKIPCKFPASREFGPGDRLQTDCILSQVLHNQNIHLRVAACDIQRVFMLRHVAKISMCFQRSPFTVRNSTQHECDMEGRSCPYHLRASPCSVAASGTTSSTRTARWRRRPLMLPQIFNLRPGLTFRATCRAPTSRGKSPRQRATRARTAFDHSGLRWFEINT